MARRLLFSVALVILLSGIASAVWLVPRRIQLSEHRREPLEVRIVPPPPLRISR
jgi:hypothetical protein